MKLNIIRILRIKKIAIKYKITIIRENLITKNNQIQMQAKEKMLKIHFSKIKNKELKK